MIPLLITFAISLILSAIGFKNYVWFISIGYGLAVAGCGVYACVCGAWIPSIILIVYGLSLSGYIIYREIATTYNKKMEGEIKDGKTIAMGVKIAIWLAVAFQYMCMVSPVTFRVTEAQTEGDIGAYIGLAICVFGLLFESIADVQKQVAKKKNPRRFVDSGLYKFVRCPNYLGEMLFWTGVLVSGFSVCANIGEWIIAILGYLLIVYTMFSGARRFEVRQNKVYKDDPEYKNYHDTTPIMISFFPLYSVEKHTWLRA